MPIYEYECTECGKVEEAVQKISDPPLTRCRHCSGKLHKLISQSTFHLKGSGWYVTDYAHGTRKDSGPSKQDSGAAASDSTQKKADNSKSSDS